MMNLLPNKTLPALMAAAIGLPGANAALAEVPYPGCYERVYDAARLAAHPGQLVTRATVLVKPIDAATKAALGPSRELDAILRFWVRGQKQSFDSHGSCRSANGGLTCAGSVSAAEDDECKTDRDGVRTNCRIISAANDGAFGVTTQSDGLMVKILRRLELVTAPYDGGPFLYLSPGNTENHAFALKPASDQACK
jgi:hypothetical protein